jgi:hypothetical protein
MSDLRNVVFTTHPNAIFYPTIFALSTLSFAPKPTFLPLVLTLAVIKTFVRIVIPRPNAWLRMFLLWVVVSSGVAFAHLLPSLQALSTPTTSLVVLTLISALTSLVALVTIFLDARVSSQSLSPWPEITFFPALWATVWFVASQVSPVGRLVTWSPVLGTDGYKWLSHWTGPVANDWVIAAWAVLCYRAVGSWYIGPVADEDQPDGPLIDHPDNDQLSRTTLLSRSGSFFILAIILAALAVPSVFYSDMPLPTYSNDTTPFTLGCVLPITHAVPPSLDDYIAETRKLNAADIVLWPEGAVRFDSDAARDAAFEDISQALPKHHIGVGFEEFDLKSDKMHPRRRTGLALLHRSGSPNSSVEIKMMYYKRHLVPSTNLFHISAISMF